MKLINWKKESIALLIVVAPIVFMAIIWKRLPSQIPMHWNLRGEVDNYGPPYIGSLIGIGTYLLFLIIPYIDPRKANYQKFHKAYYIMKFALLTLMSVIQMVVLLIGLGMALRVEKVIVMLTAVLFLVIGNYMTTFKSNYFIGIRTPWTIQNEEVWKATHRLAGKIWFTAGVIIFVMPFFLDSQILFFTYISTVALMAGIPVAYSFFMYRKMERTHTENNQG